MDFIYRNSDVSIGKGTVATAVSAAMKAKCALKSAVDYKLPEFSFGQAILGEIQNEFGIECQKDAKEI